MRKERQFVKKSIPEHIWLPLITLKITNTFGQIDQVKKFGLEALMKDGRDLGSGAMEAHGLIQGGGRVNQAVLMEENIV